MIGAILGTLISAWLDVRSKPVRTLAAIGGMVAAIVAVIVVDAASQLSQDANNEFIAWQYGRPATVTIRGAPQYITMEGPAGPSGEAREFAKPLDPLIGATIARDAEALLRANGVTQVSVKRDVGLWFLDGESLRQDAGMLVSSRYYDIQVIEMVAGTFPRETAQSGTIHVVISETKAAQLGYSPQRAIRQILWYTGPENYSRSPQPEVDSPLSPMIIDGVARWAQGTVTGDMLLVSDLPRPDLAESGSIVLAAHVDPADIGLVDALFQDFAGQRGLQDPSVRRQDRSAELAPVLDQQSITAGAVTIVALTIGGLGILGVGLATVRERAQDFGLRRALGASTRRVFSGVILQTLIEVLLAAVIAIPVAAVLIELFARQLVLGSLPLPANTGMPVSSAVKGLVAALLVGLLAGLLPAIRAAHASVVQALRG